MQASGFVRALVLAEGTPLDTVSTVRDGILAGAVLLGTFFLARQYLTLAYKRSEAKGSRLLSDDRSKDLLLGLVLIGLIAALSFPSLLDNAVVAGIFGSLAGFVFGRSTTDRSRREAPAEGTGAPADPDRPPRTAGATEG